MKKAIAMVLSVLTIASVCVFSTGAKNVMYQPNKNFDEEFYADLCEMIAEYSDENFFGEITVTVGEDVLYIDGESVPIDDGGTAPYIENGRTMMPVRGIAEAMGASVTFDPKTLTVTVEKDNDSIEMTVGDNVMQINGEDVYMISPPEIVNGRTMLPIRDVAEALDCVVIWDNETQTATFTRPLQTKRVIAHSENADTRGALMVAKGNGKTIMQFDSVEKAQKAIDRNTEKGIVAEPDKVCTVDSMSWGVEKIGAEPYYKQVKYASGNEVVVAVIDTGIDSDHPYFKNRLVPGYDFANKDSNPDSYDTTPSCRSHGTHVASTVLDVSGCNPNVKIMPLKVFGNLDVCYDSIVALAIEYAVNNGVDVINMSIGGMGTSTWFEEAIALARKHNIAVVAAAGNEGIDLRYNRYHPADIEGVITVANVTKSNKLSSSSNFGEGIVEFAAPGSEIYGAIYGGGYGYKSGTSMASPHVAGVYALIKGAHPDMSVDTITKKLMESSKKQGSKLYNGSPFINVNSFEQTLSDAFFDDVEVYDEEEHSATVYAIVGYSGIEPDKVGIMLGTSKNSMKNVYSESYDGDSSGEMEIEWDIEYDTNNRLKSNTKYYGCVYVSQGGITHTSDTFTFKTLQSDSGDPEPEPEPDPEPNPGSALRINPTSYPSGELEKGKSFNLSGRIKSDCHITDVRSYILDEDYNVVQEASGWTTTQTYVIEGSALDRGLKFGSLDEGNYYLRFTAEDESGNSIGWTSGMFTVKKKSEGVSSLRILPNAYPQGTLSYGKKFNLSGRIKSDCHITDVRSYMLDENYNVVQEASGWTTTQTYVIEGSALDRGMEFNKLTRGAYYLKYVAEDESGNRVEWISNLFYIE